MIDKAIEEGSKISSQVLSQSGLVGLAFILLLVFCLVLIWLIFSTLLSNIPPLLVSVDTFAKKLEERMRATETALKEVTNSNQAMSYEIRNLYDATQEVITEMSRVDSSVKTNTEVSNERIQIASRDHELIKNSVAEVNHKLELVINGKKFIPKKVS